MESSLIFSQLEQHDLTLTSMFIRLLLALVLGGLLGMEREQRGRPAGFRTYMLVCLGATLTMLLSQFEALMLDTRWFELASEIGVRTDVSRFGAQVINGIGFLGAGTIIVTDHQEVEGLTTAAGLWAAACMGLAIGAGFYECTLFGFVLILVCAKVFSHIEGALLARARNMNIYTEFSSLGELPAMIQEIKARGIQIFDVDVAYGDHNASNHPTAVLSMTLPHRQSHDQVLADISKLSGICVIKELL